MDLELQKIKDKVSLGDYGDGANEDIKYLLKRLERNEQEQLEVARDNEVLNILVEQAREVMIDEIIKRRVKRISGFKTANMRMFAGCLEAYDRWKNSLGKRSVE